MYYKLYRNRADIQQYGHLILYGTNYTGILFIFLQIMQDVVQSFANLVGGLFKVLQIMQECVQNFTNYVGTLFKVKQIMQEFSSPNACLGILSDVCDSSVWRIMATDVCSVGMVAAK